MTIIRRGYLSVCLLSLVKKSNADPGYSNWRLLLVEALVEPSARSGSVESELI